MVDTTRNVKRVMAWGRLHGEWFARSPPQLIRNSIPSPSMKPIGIPTRELDEGIRLCGNNIRRFILDNEALMREASDWHALALVIYALEELAKYSELKAKQHTTELTVQIDERFFGYGRESHKFKINEVIVRKLVPLEALNIYPASFDPAYFDSKAFNTEDTLISAAMRLTNLFVDWKDNQWVIGTSFLPERLMNLRNCILNKLHELEVDST